MATRDYGLDNKAGLVEGMRKAWKRGFNGTELNTDLWEIIQQGAGQTVSVAAGALTVNLGVGIDEQTIIRSKVRFQIPFRVQFHHLISQRIANNEIILEVVNADGSTTTGWFFDGTTTTSAKTWHQNAGISTPASPTGAITVTGSSATTPTIREIDARIDFVEFSDRGSDSNGGATSRAVKTRTTLDPYEDYYIQMRFRNSGGIAPATATTSSVETILVQDTNDMLVELSGSRGAGALNKSLPVNVLALPGVTNTPSVSSTTGTAATTVRNGAVTNASATVKTTAGKLLGFIVSNWGASAAFFNIYTTAPTVGTTNPTIQVLVPAGQTVDFEPPYGVTMSATYMAATDTSALLSAIAPATPLVANVQYI